MGLEFRLEKVKERLFGQETSKGVGKESELRESQKEDCSRQEDQQVRGSRGASEEQHVCIHPSFPSWDCGNQALLLRTTSIPSFLPMLQSSPSLI